MTFAVTQNFCSPTNAEYVYLCTRHSRPKLGAKLFNEIQKLGAKNPAEYGELAARLETLRYVPRLPPSSSESSSNSSTSSSSSSSSSSESDDQGPGKSKKRKLSVSSTESESDLSDGTCMCHKCKRQRKQQEREAAVEASKWWDLVYPSITNERIKATIEEVMEKVMHVYVLGISKNLLKDRESMVKACRVVYSLYLSPNDHHQSPLSFARYSMYIVLKIYN